MSENRSQSWKWRKHISITAVITSVYGVEDNEVQGTGDEAIHANSPTLPIAQTVLRPSHSLRYKLLVEAWLHACGYFGPLHTEYSLNLCTHTIIVNIILCSVGVVAREY